MAVQLKFCHACHNEFYNNDVCPQCGSDFIENVEDSSDPASFYAEDEGEDNFEPFASTTPLHRRPQPPIPPPSQANSQPRFPSPFRFTSQSSAPRPANQGPFVFGSYQQPQTPASTTPASNPGQPTNPMFMDGYRNILEQLLGGIGQPGSTTTAANGGTRIPNQDYPPFPGQPPQRISTWGHPIASQPSFLQPEGHILGGTPGQSTFSTTSAAGQAQGQQETRPTTRRFHYSVTTYGSDGRVHHITNSPNPRSDSDGRQVPVPTLEDFLGLHGMPGNTVGGVPTQGGGGGQNYAGEDTFASGSLALMLRHLMESVAPIHGDPGDYLRYGMTMDDVISQLMEQGQGSTAPPPASTQTIDSLPRFKADKSLVDGGKECTVCKDNFNLNEEVMRLPCLHVFHTDCILPWLKINGSCPVCRHTLNGDNQNPSDQPPSSSPSTSHNNDNPRSSTSPRPDEPTQAWSFSNFFSFGGGGNPRGNSGAGSGGGDGGLPRRDEMPPEEDLD